MVVFSAGSLCRVEDKPARPAQPPGRRTELDVRSPLSLQENHSSCSSLSSICSSAGGCYLKDKILTAIKEPSTAIGVMRSAIAISVAACAVALRASNAFTTRPSNVANPRSYRIICPHRTALASRPIDEDEYSPSSQFIIRDDVVPKKEESNASLRRRIRRAGIHVWERMDTLRSAGLYDDGMMPMHSGFKTNVGLLIAAFMFKWYRARFINKVRGSACLQVLCVISTILTL